MRGVRRLALDIVGAGRHLIRAEPAMRRSVTFPVDVAKGTRPNE